MAGMVKVAMTVPTVESETVLPAMMPARVTLLIGALAGGLGGEAGRVMVTATVVPRVAVPPGATVPVPLPVVTES